MCSRSHWTLSSGCHPEMHTLAWHSPSSPQQPSPWPWPALPESANPSPARAQLPCCGSANPAESQGATRGPAAPLGSWGQFTQNRREGLIAGDPCHPTQPHLPHLKNVDDVLKSTEIVGKINSALEGKEQRKGRACRLVPGASWHLITPPARLRVRMWA